MDLSLYNRLLQYINTLVTEQVVNGLSNNAILNMFTEYFQSQLYIVDTIEEMLKITVNTKQIPLVFVKDKDRGGIFKYDVNKQNINDFGTIFNGYERLLDNTKTINVKWFGAKGDGYTDDTIAIQRAINAGNKNAIIYFPKGDYFITEQLEPFTNTTWKGEGSLDYADLYYDVDSIICDHDKYYWVHFNTEENLNKFIKGDQIFLSGFTNKLTNKPHEIVQVDDTNKKVLIIHSYYTGSDYNENNIDGTARIPFATGGSAIRHRSFDGTLTIGKWFINTQGLDYFNLKDIGFIGAGINQSSGSEIKIIRDETGAMEGFQWDNVSWMDIPGNAITIEAPINSSFTNIRIKKCAFDAIRLVSIAGSAMTSTTFRNIYITSARRGFYIETAVYNIFEAIVIEGASIAFHGKVMNSNTFNSISTETVKYRTFRGGQGISFLFENGYGNVFNSPSVIYNSEAYEWVKSAFMFLGSSYNDLPVATITGGRIHHSLNLKHNILAYEQTSNTNHRIYYIDAKLSELEQEYTSPGRFLAVSQINDYNDNNQQIYRILDVYSECVECIQTDNTKYDKTTNPTSDDDSDAGYNIGDVWTNTDTNTVFLCIDNTNDNAIWKDMSLISAIEVLVDHNASIDMTTATDLVSVKIGRSFGVDIATTMVNRLYQYSYDSENKVLSLWLDVYDRLPTLYSHKVHLDNDNKGFSSEMLCSTHSIVNVDDHIYLQASFKASKQIKESTDFNWHDSEIIANDGTVYTSTSYKYIDNTEEFITVTRYQWEEDTKSLNLMFTPTRFIKTGKPITVYNPINPIINGTYDVTSVVSWKYLDDLPNTPIAIKVKIDVDLGIDYDLNVTETTGLYCCDYLSSSKPGIITLKNSSVYKVFDKYDIIHRSNVIYKQFTIPTDINNIDIIITKPYNYIWDCLKHSNIDITVFDTYITLSRNDDSTDEIIGTLIGYPKITKFFNGV